MRFEISMSPMLFTVIVPAGLTEENHDHLARHVIGGE